MELKLFVFMAICLSIKCSLSYDGYKRRLLYNENILRLRMSAQSKTCRHNLCENDPTYPAEKIHHLLQKMHNSPSYFGNVFNTISEIDISNRINGPNAEAVYCCKSNSIRMFPQSLQDTSNNKRVYIVNDGQYKQGLRFENCSDREPHLSCANGNHNFLCEQKYIIIKLLKLDEEKNILDHGEVRVPSACVLTLKTDN